MQSSSNPFSLLGSDSDEENAAAAAGAAVPMDVSGAAATATADAEFRVWKRDDHRFVNEVRRNIFSSPFSKKRSVRHQKDDDGWTSIRWNQPQFQEETAAAAATAPAPVATTVATTVAVPVAVSKAVSTEEADEYIYESATPSYCSGTDGEADTAVQTFPSLLTRGNDVLTAQMWAERIKKSLEKAKAPPVQSQERISFFRKSFTETA